MTSSEIHFLLSVNGEDHNIDIYKTTIETLEAAGYFEGIDLFVFPYDWRKNIEDTLTNEGTVEGIATQLLAKIDEVRTQTGADRVDILPTLWVASLRVLRWHDRKVLVRFVE